MELLLKYRGNIYEFPTVKEYVYDGCHKLYLITSQEDEEMARSFGYDIYDLQALPNSWEDSCPLRFIEFWDVENIKYPVIPQSVDADITRNNSWSILIAAKDDNQIEDNFNYLLSQNLIKKVI